MFAARTFPTLLRLVLAWFALSLGAAMASPWMAPATWQALCSAEGAVQWVLVDHHGEAVESGSHAPDCALCLPTSLPAADAAAPAMPPPPLGHACPPRAPVRIAQLVGAPLPARGPPTAH